ncbi:ATP-dependent helicase HrpA [Corallococcus sp. AB011P]|nr:ATP-dependent helicase HrpA [Corallococcus sp. AB011P]RKH91398.1 ATP-dependent helicase HrpA [Corallococcus sp. AB045]
MLVAFSCKAVRSILEHLGLPTRPAKLVPTQGPPQLAWC